MKHLVMLLRLVGLLLWAINNGFIIIWGGRSLSWTINKNSSKSVSVTLPISYTTFGIASATSHNYLSCIGSINGTTITLIAWNYDQSNNSHTCDGITYFAVCY